MKKILLTLTLALCITGQGFAQPLRDKLRAVPQIENLKANPGGTEYGFKESYTFFLCQGFSFFFCYFSFF